MTITFKEACVDLKAKGFYKIAHVVAIHHLLKDFGDYDITDYRFFILPKGKDFIHVAVIEHEYGLGDLGIQVRYSCAGDDLLYGLRNKFNNGGSEYPRVDLEDIGMLIESTEPLKAHPRYIRKRFRHGRLQAKVRAFLMMVKDKWRDLLSFK